MSTLEFLDTYGGQSLGELIALESKFRVDSLVLALETAIDLKLARVGLTALSSEERIVLAVEALEREVNNGGFHQFFLNGSRIHASTLVNALNAIGCPRQAELADRAIALLSIECDINDESIEHALIRGGDELVDSLSAVDTDFYACSEPIAERLFAFVKAHRENIRLLKTE
ncbi:MAG: DUF4375 domain-containing protein [Polyangiaceae bacterium]